MNADVALDGRGDSPDRGTATVIGAMVATSLLTLAMLLAQLATAVTTRHRAEAAADLAVLAAAVHAPSGRDEACDRASWVADRMRVTLERCWFEGWNALVEVHARPPGLLADFGSAKAHARAGPTEDDQRGQR